MALISQREARRLRKRVDKLEADEYHRRRRYAQEWPGGVNFDTITLSPDSAAAVRTARLLGHAVVVVSDNTNAVRLVALPHPKDDVL